MSSPVHGSARGAPEAATRTAGASAARQSGMLHIKVGNSLLRRARSMANSGDPTLAPAAEAYAARAGHCFAVAENRAQIAAIEEAAAQRAITSG